MPRNACRAAILGALFLLLIGCNDETPQSLDSQKDKVDKLHAPTQIQLQKAKSPDDDMNLHVGLLDAGAGNCAILTTPGGKTVLIDAGAPGAETAILAWLKERKIPRLDFVIATSPTKEHIGALPAVLEAIPFGTVYEAGLPIDTPEETRLHNVVKAHKGVLSVGQAEGHVTLERGVELTFIAPQDPLGKPTGDHNAWIEDHTLIFRVKYGETTLLFTGNIGAGERDWLYSTAMDLHANVLFGAHHGDRKVADLEFIHRVLPLLVVIGCRPNNPQHYPHQELIDALIKTQVVFFRTDLQGDISVRCDNATRISALSSRNAEEKLVQHAGTFKPAPVEKPLEDKVPGPSLHSRSVPKRSNDDITLPGVSDAPLFHTPGP